MSRGTTAEPAVKSDSHNRNDEVRVTLSKQAAQPADKCSASPAAVVYEAVSIQLSSTRGSHSQCLPPLSFSPLPDPPPPRSDLLSCLRMRRSDVSASAARPSPF